VHTDPTDPTDQTHLTSRGVLVTIAARTLHLTNGSSIVPMMREAGIEGIVVPWNDVLHEGPVPTGVGPSALRELRAAFLAGCGWGSYQDILRELEERDAAVESHKLDEIVLWFEHDLFDQLQLIQILDRLAVDGHVRITAVLADTYLGRVPATMYPTLFADRRIVTSTEQLAARDAWQAFRSADPRDIVAALPRVTALPHLAKALQRHLEQFPSLVNGTSRTEQQTLDAVAAGITRIADLFVAANHEHEEAYFMGDAGFLYHITSLVRGTQPLLQTIAGEVFAPSSDRTLDAHLELTALGERVMRGEQDRVALSGIDRWLGGVHLNGMGPVWRWDRERRTVRIA
jgi:hypothetical protein